jgi:single-strand DNA-binding protein
LINKIILQGHVGKLSKLHKTNSGRAVVTLSIATHESCNDKNTSDHKTRTDWHRVVFFGLLAEIVAEYVKSGNVLYAEGQQRTREYEDSSQIKRIVTEVMAKEFKMWSKNKKGESDDLSAVQGMASADAVDLSDDVPL